MKFEKIGEQLDNIYKYELNDKDKKFLKEYALKHIVNDEDHLIKYGILKRFEEIARETDEYNHILARILLKKKVKSKTKRNK